MLKRLLDNLNHQPERRGLLVREESRVVSFSRRPLKVIDVLPEDREEGDDVLEVIVRYSDDTDAAWLRKGNRKYYGYKIHEAPNGQNGFLLDGHFTPANRADTQEFADLLDEIGPMAGGHGCIYADKRTVSSKH